MTKSAKMTNYWGRLALAVGACALTSPAAAQVALEENPSSLPEAAASTPLQLDPLPDASVASAAQLGVNLTGLVLIDTPEEQRAVSSANGVDTSRLAALPSLDLDAALAGFVGQPLSQQLLAEIRNVIVQAHRDAGYAFVSVLVPQQEVSNGSVQLLVNRFRLGDVTASGATRSTPQAITGNLDLQRGALIRTDRLVDDLNWLNRNPFQSLRVSASPGATFGKTDLTIRVAEERPWTGYAGLSNHGTNETGGLRAILGGAALIPGTADHILSYQHTASQNAFGAIDDDTSFDADAGGYSAHDLSYSLPVARQATLTVRAAQIHSRVALEDPFISDETTTILSADLRRAMPGWGGFVMEQQGGLAFKRAERVVSFDGAPVSTPAIEVLQFEAGISGRRATDDAVTAFAVTLTYSPGDLTDLNTDDAFALYGGGADATANYGYLHAVMRQSWQLTNATVIDAVVRGQLANGPLPVTEALSAGGPDTLRGYSFGEVSGDQGVLVSAAWHVPFASDAGTALAWQVNVSPFVDLAILGSHDGTTSADLASAGVSLNGTIGRNLEFGIDIGMPLVDGPVTPAGEAVVHAGLTARF